MLDRLDYVRSLGRGAVGDVYEARDRTTGERFVVKRLLPEAHGKGVVARFEREALLMSRLKHENIMPIVHVDVATPDPYFVMPFREGHTLAARTDRERLATARVVRLARDVASGLGEAHRLGIVHRDLKPANIFLEATGRAVLLDFGLAKDTGDLSSLTATGAVMGTPAYMAPEQIRGNPASAPADLYSLGVILLELFLGVNSFYDPDPLETFRRHLEDRPRRLDSALPDRVTPPLADLVDALLSKKAATRPTAEATLAALAPIIVEVDRKAQVATRLMNRPRE